MRIVSGLLPQPVERAVYLARRFAIRQTVIVAPAGNVSLRGLFRLSQVRQKIVEPIRGRHRFYDVAFRRIQLIKLPPIPQTARPEKSGWLTHTPPRCSSCESSQTPSLRRRKNSRSWRIPSRNGKKSCQFEIGLRLSSHGSRQSKPLSAPMRPGRRPQPLLSAKHASKQASK